MVYVSGAMLNGGACQSVFFFSLIDNLEIDILSGNYYKNSEVNMTPMWPTKLEILLVKLLVEKVVLVRLNNSKSLLFDII